MSKRRSRKLRAVDLYSGVGGWALGLKMAGIDVVASYDKWGPANETNFKNNHHQAQTVDIRRLALSDLPKRVDIVVGSPPCTQFSYANRGGGGDIKDGLQDIIKFLKVVKYLKPKTWAMENVPRVAAILKKELTPKGKLSEFIDLGMSYCVVNMQDFGLPQRRRRCIAGKFDADLLRSYCSKGAAPTLGKVVSALAANKVVDPLYGIKIDPDDLHDHVTEDYLNEEETRINRAAKVTHPVYNSMPFPDKLGRTVRTITATCTRVSRESVIIQEPGQRRKYRRLTVRERASLQGFPITFQFYGDSYSQKLRMVGNALPPLFSYFLAQSMKGVAADRLMAPAVAFKAFVLPVPVPKTTRPDTPGSRYPWHRTFRFAIPSLRLKSGVRFELRNQSDRTGIGWEIRFVFGNSKSIHCLSLSRDQADAILSALPATIATMVKRTAIECALHVRGMDIPHLQDVWSHRGPGGAHPFMLLDYLDETGKLIASIIAKQTTAARTGIEAVIKSEYKSKSSDLVGVEKLKRNAALIVSGIVIGAYVNVELARHGTQVEIPLRTRKKVMHG